MTGCSSSSSRGGGAGINHQLLNNGREKGRRGRRGKRGRGSCNDPRSCDFSPSIRASAKENSHREIPAQPPGLRSGVCIYDYKAFSLSQTHTHTQTQPCRHAHLLRRKGAGDVVQVDEEQMRELRSLSTRSLLLHLLSLSHLHMIESNFPCLRILVLTSGVAMA